MTLPQPCAAPSIPTNLLFVDEEAADKVAVAAEEGSEQEEGANAVD